MTLKEFFASWKELFRFLLKYIGLAAVLTFGGCLGYHCRSLQSWQFEGWTVDEQVHTNSLWEVVL